MNNKVKIHELKLNEYFCDAVLSGEKSFEARENDRGYQKGDHIKFTPVDSFGLKVYRYSKLEDKEYEITYVLNGHGINEGYVVFSFKEV